MKVAPTDQPRAASVESLGANAGAGSNIETELKLEVPSRLASKVLAHAALRTRPIGRLSRSRLLGVYYDTPQFDLWHAGISVRLRRSTAGWVQTIKWSGGALGGLHRRNELERPVPDQALAFDGIEARPDLAALLDVRLQHRLKPLFVTEFERAARLLNLPDGSSVEASLDRGQIVCGTATQPISELELELKAGSALALFDIADALLSDLSLRPAHRSKAQRGYVLAGLAFPPIKAVRATIDTTADIRAAVAMFVGAGLEQVQANESGMLAANDIEYLHQMRVGVRRLRSCLNAFGPVLPAEGLRTLQAELKWFGSRLGDARDWDVFTEEALPVLRTGLAEVGSSNDLEELVRAAGTLRESARRVAIAAVRSKRTNRLLLDLGRAAAGGGILVDAPTLKQPVTAYGSELLERRLLKVMRRGKKAVKAGSVKDLHALRIAVKKLRYAVEFVGALYTDAEHLKGYRNRLVKLQDCLGRICDAATVTARVREAMPGNGALIDCVSGWNACVIQRERSVLRSLWRAFRKTARFW